MINSLISARAIAVLAAISAPPPSGIAARKAELLEALADAGFIAERDAIEYEVEFAGNDTLDVVDLVAGTTVVVTPSNGNVETPEPDTVSMPGSKADDMAPVAYFRVLVSKNGAKLFRTSRLRTAREALNVRAGISEGFRETAYAVELLSVDTNRNGHLVGLEEFAALNNAVLAEIANAS